MSESQPETDAASPLEPEVLFHESGATLWWLVTGPIAAVAMLAIQLSAGVGWAPFLPVLFLVLVTGFLGLQVKAARMHTSVELTAGYLRQGAETILVSEIVQVFPKAEGNNLHPWQSARALGELTGVPRGRTGIGLELSNDRTAQAWARRYRAPALRTALEAVVNKSAT